MTDPIFTSLMQFGSAGLIGLLWLYERRHSANRDRQLDETHRRLFLRERELDALLKVINDNTRAINGLRSSQGRLIRLLGTRRHGKPKSQKA